jgi:putative serine protease PepD
VLIFAALLQPLLAGCGQGPESPTKSEAAVEDDHDTPPTHGFLGIGFESVDGTPLIVQTTVPGSGAESAGIQPGDQLLTVGDLQQPTFGQIYQALESTRPGQQMPVTVERDGKSLEFSVELLSFTQVQQSMELRQSKQSVE